MGRQTIWTEDRLNEAAKLWNEGLTTLEISLKMGIPKGTITSNALSHRDLFPKRWELNTPIPKPEPVVAPERMRRTLFEGRWIEHVTREVNGVEITMPRVSFIDGIREGGD